MSLKINEKKKTTPPHKNKLRKLQPLALGVKREGRGFGNAKQKEYETKMKKSPRPSFSYCVLFECNLHTTRALAHFLKRPQINFGMCFSECYLVESFSLCFCYIGNSEKVAFYTFDTPRLHVV